MKYCSLILLLIVLTACNQKEEIQITPTLVPEDLINHSQEFKKGVLSFNDAIHVAIGFSLANSIMVEAEGGKIIIDTTCLLYTSPSPRDKRQYRMPSSA